jgi:hypothetical protein
LDRSLGGTRLTLGRLRLRRKPNGPRRDGSLRGHLRLQADWLGDFGVDWRLRGHCWAVSRNVCRTRHAVSLPQGDFHKGTAGWPIFALHNYRTNRHLPRSSANRAQGKRGALGIPLPGGGIHAILWRRCAA